MWQSYTLLSLISQGGSSALILTASNNITTDVLVELVKAGANLDLQDKVSQVMNTGTQDGRPVGTSYYCLYKSLKHKYSHQHYLL